jgi:hypothetical protein
VASAETIGQRELLTNVFDALGIKWSLWTVGQVADYPAGMERVAVYNTSGSNFEEELLVFEFDENGKFKDLW